MSRAYSWDLRQRIVDAITQGETRRAATAASKFRPPRLFGSSSGQIERVQSSRSGGGGKLGPYQNAIIAKVEAQPDITMPDLATWLEEHQYASGEDRGGWH